MRTSIDERGTLIIEAESPLESFALNQWWKEALVGFDVQEERTTTKINGGSLIVKTAVPK